MNQQENELLIMILSEMKDMKKMQEHQGQILDEHTEHFKRIDQHLDGVDQHLNVIDQRLDGVEEHLDTMSSKLDYVYDLALDNYGAIKEYDMCFKLLEGRTKTPRNRTIRMRRKWNKREE